MTHPSQQNDNDNADLEIDMQLEQRTWTTRAACVGKEEVFFPDSYTSEAIRDARYYCAQCPVFNQCVAWGTEHYADISVGIYFGYTETERKAFWLGTMRFSDWRATRWQKGITRRVLSSREREARHKGVAAVCDLYDVYSVSVDEARRTEIIVAYRRWVEDQDFPATYIEAEARAERLVVAQRDQRRLPPKLRPPCGSGCPPEKMYRQRTNAAGAVVWACYQCRAKVIVAIAKVAAR